MVSLKTAWAWFRFYVVIFLLIILALGYQLFSEPDLTYDETIELHTIPDFNIEEEDGIAVKLKYIPHPLLLWWSPLTGERGATKTCGNVKCFFTANRHYKDHPNLKVFMFYGTDYKPEDLPLPRLPHHEWAVLHEESPKNNYLFSHEETLLLFNHTGTFRRYSDYPITTQYLRSLDDLVSREYLVSVEKKNQLLTKEGLALVAYVQSDCNAPSDRDHLVQMLQRHIAVDSYGSCIHNKDLPKHLQDPLKGMDHKDFYHYMAKYKFILALENAICEDYITEKFWRPFIIGSVPIVFGSPKAKDYIPANKSAIFVDDFHNVKELVDLILKINGSDALYNEYLGYKRTGVQNDLLKKELKNREWVVDNDEGTNFIDGFECAICRRIHENQALESKGLPIKKRQANLNHYGCPRPESFSDSPSGSLHKIDNLWWMEEYKRTFYTSKAAFQLIQEGKVFGATELNNKVNQIQYGWL